MHKAPVLSLLSLLSLLAACGDSVPAGQTPAQAPGQDRDVPAISAPATAARPVRVGEFGPNFAACTGAGTTRNLAPGATLPVRTAPFDNAAAIGSVAPAARFFVCTRSHDQKWLGVVYDESGALTERCGVAEPIAGRRDYEGPCRSGWVESAFVKLIAGAVDQPASALPAPPDNRAAPPPEPIPGR
jgi:hypothetical protein